MLPSPLVQPSWSHPVAPVASLARAEDLAEGARADGVHSAGLEVHQNVAGHVAAAGRLEEEHGDALELEVGVAVVGGLDPHKGAARASLKEEGGERG